MKVMARRVCRGLLLLWHAVLRRQATRYGLQSQAQCLASFILREEVLESGLAMSTSLDHFLLS